VDEDGKYSGKKETYCLSGFVRAKGISDQIVSKLGRAWFSWFYFNPSFICNKYIM